MTRAASPHPWSPVGGGDVGDLIRDYDWAATPLGPIADWPAPVRTIVQTLLLSPVPTVAIWGREGILVYNRGYAEVCGPRHPEALGGRLLEIWPEARSFNARVIDSGLAGRPLSFRARELELRRHGRPETVWMDLEYTPILDDRGAPVGTLATVIDITERVLSERRTAGSESRLRFLDRLGQATADARDAAAVLEITTRLVGEHLGLSNCAYADMDPDGDGFTIRGNWHRATSPSILGRYSLAAFGTLAVRELNAGRPLVINDNLAEIAPHEARTFQDIGIAATICMPLVKNGRLAALMAIHHAAPHCWTETELALIREVTERCWAHIERVGAEAGLRVSEGRLRALVNATSDAVFRLSPDWQEMRQLDGRGFLADTAQPSLRWLDRYVEPADRPEVSAAIDDAIRRKSLFEIEHRVRRADGSVGWTLSRAVPVTDAHGAVVEWFGTASDVTFRHEAEARLRESEARLRTLTDIVPAFVWFASPDGCLHFLNDRWCAYTGLSLEASLPDGWIAAVHPDDRARTAAIWSDARERGVTYEIEVRYRRHDGAYRWYVARAEPLRDPSGLITTWFGTSTDIHDRKLAEEGLRELNETLESRVVERTSELLKAEEALRHSQKMEAVGQLTGGVAHDFNNLLTIIRSSVDFLRRPDLPEARKARYLDAMSGTVDRAAKLTGQLLAFARRQALDPQVFDLGERLRAIADLLDTMTGARIRIVTEIPDAACFVRADLSQFETALVNMAVNARDAMEGEGTLTLGLACGGALPPIRGHRASAQPFAAIALSDTGSGIAPGVLDRIFEPFFTTKEIGKGTGLGLSQVFGFAKQSGGNVTVESALGRGTTFTLYLPEVAVGTVPEDAAATAEPLSPVGSGQRVLVVEDNVEVGTFATQILEDLGYETTWTANAEEALERLGADGSGFDVVFSDVVMPGMGGFALAQELRHRLPHLPVLLASGYSQVLAQDQNHGFKVLHKPYSAEQLGHLLRQVTVPKTHRTPA